MGDHGVILELDGGWEMKKIHNLGRLEERRKKGEGREVGGKKRREKGFSRGGEG